MSVFQKSGRVLFTGFRNDFQYLFQKWFRRFSSAVAVGAKGGLMVSGAVRTVTVAVWTVTASMWAVASSVSNVTASLYDVEALFRLLHPPCGMLQAPCGLL